MYNQSLLQRPQNIFVGPHAARGHQFGHVWYIHSLLCHKHSRLTSKIRKQRKKQTLTPEIQPHFIFVTGTYFTLTVEGKLIMSFYLNLSI